MSRRFQGLPGSGASRAMGGDTLGHLFVANFGCRYEQNLLSQFSSQLLGIVTLTTARATQNQNKLW
jgi:hypothetical protein